ncbi:hypothetical protein NOCA1120233 [metagenome]|uniref:Uncharacterized protein n=1 Tax=metagenome TaxID=256318 RepID=A0A2P2C494_9ZZZZ
MLLRSADLNCGFGDLELGQKQLDESVAIHLRHPPTRDAAHALETRVNILWSLGRDELVRNDVERGLAIARAIGAPDVEQRFQALRASLRLAQGDPRGAIRLALDAMEASDPENNPVGSVRVAAYATEVLLSAGARASVVAAATTDAVRQVHRWDLRGVFVDGVLSRLAEAFLREGDVAAAAQVVEPLMTAGLGTDLRRCQRVQGAIDLRRGDPASALARLGRVTFIDTYGVGAAGCDATTADVHLWSVAAHAAVTCLDRAVGLMSTGTLALEAAELLVMRARAAADVADADHLNGSARLRLREQVQALRAASTADPFGPGAFGADLSANTTTWQCELDRILGEDSAAAWARAASAWDALHRPHDAAYCRWRAATCALREGQGTVAARLLKRAATDAREHVPLSRAIAGTAAG